MHPYPWQQDDWLAFERRIVSGKLPHALLFSGAKGIGKQNFAETFVYRLFCHDVQQGIACGKCDACHLLNIGNHPDLYRVAKLEDKRDISVDQIRALISNVNLKPHSAIKKIAFIEQTELMSENASNSLLKTLEEPPESCLLILITHRPDKLLPTIRSRCQAQAFVLPERSLALEWLKSNIEADDLAQAEKILALAGGAPLQAVIYAKEGTLQQRDDMFTALQELQNGKQNPVSVAGAWLKKDLEVTLYCMISWLTDMIRLKVSPQPPLLGNPDLKVALTSLSKQSELSRMLKFHEHIIDMQSWKNSNINVQSILEEMLVQWSRLKISKI